MSTVARVVAEADPSAVFNEQVRIIGWTVEERVALARLLTKKIRAVDDRGISLRRQGLGTREMVESKRNHLTRLIRMTDSENAETLEMLCDSMFGPHVYR